MLIDDCIYIKVYKSDSRVFMFITNKINNYYFKYRVFLFLIIIELLIFNSLL